MRFIRPNLGNNITSIQTLFQIQTFLGNCFLAVERTILIGTSEENSWIRKVIDKIWVNLQDKPNKKTLNYL